jgi:ABC-type branched-subunit amino acid transport system substrate-binding protein
MVREEAAGGGGRVTRRDLLRTIGAGGAVALAGCDGDGDGDTPTPTPDVTLLLATALSGEYGRVGTHQEQGFQLAIDHINEGGGLVDEAFDDLSGDGLLGRTVSATTRDTVNTADTARDRVGRFLEGEEVGMVTGGVGGDVCLALSEVAAENDVPYLAGTAPNPELTGGQCSPTTFRVQPHAVAIVEALGDVLTEELPDNSTFVRVSSQASEGTAHSDAESSYFGRPWTPS